MSYKTNPIFNRLKIIKGWKTPYLPTKTLNYTRDISLWFKVYLLLKLFLNLKKIQLLSCEIRFEQQNKKILYLVINQKKNQKKKGGKKRRISLKKKVTPLRKIKNRNAKFFLYKNWFLLKQVSFWNQNQLQKKVLSKFWLTKPQSANLINTFEKIMIVRQSFQKNLKFSRKNKNFIPTQHLKFKFSTNKQKQILTQKLKIKKINNLLFAKLFFLSQQKNSQILEKIILNLQNKIHQNQLEIQKINKLYSFFLRWNWLPRKKIFLKKTQTNNWVFNQIQRSKEIFLRKTLKKEFLSFNRTRFFKQKRPTFLLEIKKDIFPKVSKKIRKYRNQQISLKKIFHLNFLIAQLQKRNFSKQNYSLFYKNFFQLENKNLERANSFEKDFFVKNALKYSLRKLSKKQQFQFWFRKLKLWQLVKRKKKKNKKKFLRTLKKKFKLTLKKKMFEKQLSFWKKTKLNRRRITHNFLKNIQAKQHSVKKEKIAQNYQYRLPLRKSYFFFLQFNAKLKLKFLIQDFVQKYFSIPVEAKVLHFLNEHKNQNYFRLVFPIWKKKRKQLIKKFRQKSWRQKQMFFHNQFKFLVCKKKNQQRPTAKFLSNSLVLQKKSFSILSRKKIQKARIKNSFRRFKNTKDFRHSFKYFIPTLIHFSRTLDPTFLVNIFAKVLYRAKKQTWMLNTIKDLLKLLPLGKNVGYKIALAGRINSSDKSRLIYITRKNVPLQVFDKNMNYAYSQAKTRIGVFGIKMWIYF